MDAMGTYANDLDELSKEFDEATEELDAAEAAWDELYDAVAENLKDEMAAEQRKGDPAEHTITSVTRRQHRAEYQRLRRAKRRMEKADRKLKSKTAALSGRQSELAALRDEMRALSMSGRPN
jgi:chromosome segregation ATPase